MCSSSQHDPDLPLWLRTLVRWAWTRRDQLALPVGSVLAVTAIGLILFFRFAPSDLDLAEADLSRAREVVKQIEADALHSMESARRDAGWEAHHRKEIESNKHSDDPEWLRWQEAYRRAHADRYANHIRRRDALLALATDYIPLLAESEREILRARTARDQGHPVRVGTRVRDILAPVLDTR